jgi:regulator of protease activity HflC (stomatin/prohibitin superfamily)
MLALVLNAFAHRRIPMHKLLFTFTLIGQLLMSTASAQTTAPQSPTGASDKEAALAPLRDYVRAQQTGNADFIRKAFAKDAKVVGYLQGQLISWSVDEYAARFTGKPAADEAQRQRSVELLDINVDAAVGKVVLDYPSIKFTDHMALLKLDGEWKIVGKTFHAQAK